MNLLDKFLGRYNLTRYEVSKMTGITESTLQRQAKKPLERYTISLLRSLSMMTGSSTTDVLIELEEIEKDYDSLLGFRSLLEKYNVSFPDLEYQLYSLIKEIESTNIEILPFTFNRFENEQHNDIEEDLRQAMQNAIAMLEEKTNELR